MSAARKAGFLLVVASLYIPPQVAAAASPYEIDVNELDQKHGTSPKQAPQPKKPKQIKPKKPPKPIVYKDGMAHYTVQESDYRTRILAKHLHIPEEELLRILPEILRLNSISSLSEVEIGQTLLVPLQPPGQPAEPEGPAAPGAPPPQEVTPPPAPSQRIPFQ